MSITNKTETIPQFLNFVSVKKKTDEDWAFLHIKSKSNEVNVEEIQQFLDFQLQQDKPYVLDLSDDEEICLVVQNTNRKLEYIDKKIYETFSSDEVVAVTNTFDENGLNQFSKLMAPHIENADIPAQVSLKRLARTGNSIMVLDDDLMVIKQMEHILGSFGHVVALQDHAEFLDAYKQYAPDILFLDIHLQNGARGPAFMSKLLSEIDPFAHVIIISSDTAVDTVMDIKTKGVKGFVVKPFDRNKLFKHVMNTPTFTPKSS